MANTHKHEHSHTQADKHTNKVIFVLIEKRAAISQPDIYNICIHKLDYIWNRDYRGWMANGVTSWRAWCCKKREKRRSRYPESQVAERLQARPLTTPSTHLHVRLPSIFASKAIRWRLASINKQQQRASSRHDLCSSVVCVQQVSSKQQQQGE